MSILDNRNNQIIIAAIIIIVLAGGLWYTTRPVQEEEELEPIKIGFIQHLSGSNAINGLTCQQGVMIAVDEFNDAGGIDGRRIEVIYEDHAGKNDQAISAFRKLVDVDQVIAIVGPGFSSKMLVIAPLAIEEEIVFVGSGSSPSLTEYKEVFRIFPSDVYRSLILGKAIWEEGGESASFITVADDWGRKLMDEAIDVYEGFGGKIDVELTVSPEETDFRTIITKLKAAGSSINVNTFHGAQTILYYKQCAELNFIEPVAEHWMVMGYDPVAATETKGAMVGSLNIAPRYAKDTDEHKEFVAKLKDRFGVSEPYPYHLFGYDQMTLLLRAMEQSDLTYEGIISEMIGMEFQGVFGYIKMDENGDNVVATYDLLRIEEEGYTTLKTVTYP